MMPWLTRNGRAGGFQPNANGKCRRGPAIPRIITPGAKRRPSTRRPILTAYARSPQRWEAILRVQMPGASRIVAAMCGNGARITGTKISSRTCPRTRRTHWPKFQRNTAPSEEGATIVSPRRAVAVFAIAHSEQQPAPTWDSASPIIREDRMGVGPQLQQNAQSASLDDATVVSGKTAPADDATVVLEQRPGTRAEADTATPMLAKKSTSTGADDSTSARRNSGAKSVARPTGAGGGGFLGSIASALVSRGLLPEREAISLALRARDLGYTLFYAMALDPALA